MLEELCHADRWILSVVLLALGCGQSTPSPVAGILRVENVSGGVVGGQRALPLVSRAEIDFVIQYEGAHTAYEWCTETRVNGQSTGKSVWARVSREGPAMEARYAISSSVDGPNKQLQVEGFWWPKGKPGGSKPSAAWNFFHPDPNMSNWVVSLGSAGPLDLRPDQEASIAGIFSDTSEPKLAPSESLDQAANKVKAALLVRIRLHR